MVGRERRGGRKRRAGRAVTKNPFNRARRSVNSRHPGGLRKGEAVSVVPRPRKHHRHEERSGVPVNEVNGSKRNVVSSGRGMPSGRGLSLRSRPPPTVSTEALSCPDTKAIYAPHTAGATGERADDERLLCSFIVGSGAGGCIAFSSSSDAAFTDTNANYRVRTPRSNRPARSLPWRGHRTHHCSRSARQITPCRP